MTISYPLTPPSSPKPSAVLWTEINPHVVSISEISGMQSVYEHPGERWGVSVSIDPLDRSEAQPWIAFLSALRGRLGTFYLGSDLCSTPLGAGAGGNTVRVKGASQVGKTLITDGWPLSTLVLKAGDRIQIETRYYRVLQDATTDGAGEVTLDLWPRLPGHPDNSIITTINPKGLFRLVDGNVPVEEAGRDSKFPINFSAEEAR